MAARRGCVSEFKVHAGAGFCARTNSLYNTLGENNTLLGRGKPNGSTLPCASQVVKSVVENTFTL
jgi:hypothetical protein